MKFLRTREKGSTKSLAERLGVSRKTVQRYLSGASTKPNKRLQAALVQETESEWQPQIRVVIGVVLSVGVRHRYVGGLVGCPGWWCGVLGSDSGCR
ncbi:helix-turn-helix domain-containing protein [Streptomyces sp. NPDC005989]|uniref:helix-turn-helix domain-containing protein n=1 Tax=unclassified Streptomyces TaxID=2593676 RepID=UPI0033C7049D